MARTLGGRYLTSPEAFRYVDDQNRFPVGLGFRGGR